MNEQFYRTELLIGQDSLEKLFKSHVAVFGSGGVGSYAAEALVRAGVGTLTVIDNDVVNITNINRQLIATHDTIGVPKVDVMKERLASINPDAKVTALNHYYDANSDIDLTEFDYILDAIDVMTSKLLIIERAKKAGVPIISAMGAGNKLNPSEFTVADINETTVCPLAKIIRKELKARNISDLKVVYSKEPPLKIPEHLHEPGKKRMVGSISFSPPVVGFIAAGEVVRDLIQGYMESL
ncbi:MAG: tRNA threonylcarbamoyladenosine dehydratase [Defluviitaleaceae bacterium]|nr:tRNA threonylcarbamoyladenosine dehydratase [Defluviitaleaceae bacterium]